MQWQSTSRSHTHTRLTALCLGLPRWAGTRKVKSIWILLKQETVSGSGIGWDICKSAPHSRQITLPAPHRSVFSRPDALPATQPTVSKHWRRISSGEKVFKSLICLATVLLLALPLHIAVIVCIALIYFYTMKLSPACSLLHSGYQTLGEEYVNLIQVDSSLRRMPSQMVCIKL